MFLCEGKEKNKFFLNKNKKKKIKRKKT